HPLLQTCLQRARPRSSSGAMLRHQLGYSCRRPAATWTRGGMQRGDRGSVLATLLFTDIVGSTQLADQLGDRRWREVLARHHEIVRRELRQFQGREIDTAGDGFFAA